MIEGALILILGVLIGAVAQRALTQRNKPEEPKEKPYDKYKNKDGLYSRRSVKESG